MRYLRLQRNMGAKKRGQMQQDRRPPLSPRPEPDHESGSHRDRRKNDENNGH
ncbi:MAG: hypothetical protein KF778_16890 [Rhodocyclaceae bacterium]|nr:hypothetical protein [Rhodocyclaceae bacterium]MBX3670080.1 hypothetical protein [Rhodocyclaceae bacterium]